jgi:hypothetical protein
MSVVSRLYESHSSLSFFAERALAPVSPSSCGICSIINSLLLNQSQIRI